jgi:predicted ATPase
VASVVDEVGRRRLVTLIGTGGVGKTRLALESARQCASAFRDGAWAVELASISDEAAVVHAVAATLGVALGEANPPAEALADGLRARRMLVVIDNCEHVVGGVRNLVDSVLGLASDVHILATSREPLALASETVVPIGPLDPVSDGVELFCDRARSVDAGFHLDAADRPVVEAICERLDGIPLAIELAAARARSLSLQDLATRLDDRLGFLRSNAHGVEARHQTLRATIEWSYRLLDDDSRCLFERLGVFGGTFDREAAVAICSEPPLEPGHVDDLLDGLVDRSMLTVDRGGATTRYRLLDSLREFAAQELTASGDRPAVRDRHLGYLVGLAQQTDRAWRTPGPNDADGRFAREWDNLRDALRWAVASDNVDAAIRLAQTISPWAYSSGVRPEGAQWVNEAVSMARRHDRLSAELLGLAAAWARGVGEDELGIALADAGIALASEPLAGETHYCWGARLWCAAHAGRIDTLVHDAGAQLTALKKRGDPFDLVIWGVYTLLALDEADVTEQAAILRDVAGSLRNPVTATAAAFASLAETWRLGQLDVALEHADRAVSLARRCGNGVLGYNSSQTRLVVLLERGMDDPRIPRYLGHFIDRARYIPNPWPHRWLVINALAGYLVILGSLEPAGVLLGAHDHHHPGTNIFLARVHATTIERIATHPTGVRWMDRGARLTPDEAFAYASATLAPMTSATEPSREMEPPA